MSPESELRLRLLRSAPLDTWIALSEDESRIVAIGATYSEIVERSESAGEFDPVILKTPQRWALPFLNVFVLSSQIRNR